MDFELVREFIEIPTWKPQVFTAEDIVHDFDTSLLEARRIVKTVNAGDPAPTVIFHDLQEYLKDLLGISEVPTNGTQVSVAAHWLVAAGGWGFYPKYAKYRYVDPLEPIYRYTLRGALRVHFNRHHGSYVEPEESPSVLLLTHMEPRGTQLLIEN